MDSDYLYIAMSLMIPLIVLVTVITFLIIYSNKYKNEVDKKLKSKYLNTVIGLSIGLFLVLMVFIYLVIKAINVLNRTGEYEIVEKPQYSPYKPYSVNSVNREYSPYKPNLETVFIPNTLNISSSPSPRFLNLRRLSSSSERSVKSDYGSEDKLKKTPTFPLSIY